MSFVIAKKKKKVIKSTKTFSNSAKYPFNNYVFSNKELGLTPWSIHEYVKSIFK